MQNTNVGKLWYCFTSILLCDINNNPFLDVAPPPLERVDPVTGITTGVSNLIINPTDDQMPSLEVIKKCIVNPSVNRNQQTATGISLLIGLSLHELLLLTKDLPASLISSMFAVLYTTSCPPTSSQKYPAQTLVGVVLPCYCLILKQLGAVLCNSIVSFEFTLVEKSFLPQNLNGSFL